MAKKARPTADAVLADLLGDDAAPPPPDAPGPPAADPADPFASIRWTGDTEADDRLEAAAVLSVARRVDRDVERNTNPDYSLTLVFVSAEQAQLFAKKMGWTRHALDYRPVFLDGLAVARELGVELPETPASLLTRGRDPGLWRETGIVPDYPG